jgi:hypothetical protein
MASIDEFNAMLSAGQASKNALMASDTALNRARGVDLREQRNIARDKMGESARQFDATNLVAQREQALKMIGPNTQQTSINMAGNTLFGESGLGTYANNDPLRPATGTYDFGSGVTPYQSSSYARPTGGVTYGEWKPSTIDKPTYGYAMGGVVGMPSQGEVPFADGGDVAPGYPAYVKAAGKDALSPQQYAQIAGAIISQRQQSQLAARAAGQTQLYANGGMVTDETSGAMPMMGGMQDVGGAMVDGPGTGKSDSIPAMIDGAQPARLSKGEFVIPRHVVDYFGTKHFDQLIEKARMAGKKKAKKGAM